MTPYVSSCRQIWMIAYPWVLSLQDLVMRRTRSGEETQHARSPFRAAPGIASPEVSGAVLFTDSEAARSAEGDRTGVRVLGRAILLRLHNRGGVADTHASLTSPVSVQRRASKN